MNKPTASILRTRERGFTLVEAVVALAILGGLLGLAGPALAGLIASVRLSAATEGVLANLHLARSEAIKTNARVVYCKSADGAACTQSGGWQRGGIVFHDANNNGMREPAERILYHQQPMTGTTSIQGNTPLASYVSYTPHGLARHAGSGAFQAGTLTVCLPSAGPTEGRQVIINSGGRPRVQKVMLEQCA